MRAICFFRIFKYLWALKSDELGGLVGHRAGRLGTRRARHRLGHLLILILESLLTKVAIGLRLETLHRLRTCRSPLPSSEILGGNSIEITPYVYRLKAHLNEVHYKIQDKACPICNF